MKRTAIVLAVAAFLGLSVSSDAAVLIHQYTFNDGTAKDSVGTADGTLAGGTTITAGAANFNGTSATINIPGVATDVGSATTITFASWVTWGGGGEWQVIGNFSNNGSSAWFAFGPSSSSPGLGGAYIDSNGHTPSTATPLAVGTPSYVVAAIDGNAGTATLYVNGTPAATGPFNSLASMMGGSTLHNNIGGVDEFGDPFFEGSIDQFSIYSGVLTPAEVSANYLAGPIAVPEPAGLSLLGVGTLALLARRRSIWRA